MVNLRTLRVWVALVILITAAGCGSTKNYRDADGRVELETRAIDGVAK